jgi:hypothetical protein
MGLVGVVVAAAKLWRLRRRGECGTIRSLAVHLFLLSSTDLRHRRLEAGRAADGLRSHRESSP